MKILVDYSLIESGKFNDQFPCECKECKKVFYKKKREILKALNNEYGHSGNFCSFLCLGKSKSKLLEVQCANCKKLFYKKTSEIKKTKNNFCSHSCSATFNNVNRIFTKKRKDKKDRFCLTCGKTIEFERKYCSHFCKPKKITQENTKEKLRNIAIERYKKNPELHPNRKCAGIKESYPEKMFKIFLEEQGLKNNIDFVQQHKIGNFFVDFYFFKINLGVEIDGERWHNKKSQREINREQFIKSQIDLIRFNAKDITKKNKEKDILNLIKQIKQL